MNRPGLVKEFAKTAVGYGQALNQYQQSQESVKHQKSNLENLRRWIKKPETRKASADARKMLRMEISEMQKRLKIEKALSKRLARQVAHAEQTLEIKTRQLVAAE